LAEKVEQKLKVLNSIDRRLANRNDEDDSVGQILSQYIGNNGKVL
jgi:hypothetical protein